MTKKCPYITAILLLFLLLSFVPSYAFRLGTKLEVNGSPIDIEVGHLVPNVADWNNDGKKDLIVGQFNQGKIRLYLNNGTDSDPRFDNYEYIQSSYTDISLAYG